MLALPGVLGLIVAVYLRPHEWTPVLHGVPVLHISMAFAVLGFGADISAGNARLTRVPTLVPAAIFTIWCVVTVALRDPGLAVGRASGALIPFGIYLVLSQAVQSRQALAAVTTLLLAAGLFVAVVGTDQSGGQWSCVRYDPSSVGAHGVSDGRPCPVDDDHSPSEAAAACSIGGEIDTDYRCERVGAFATMTVDGGRIAYLGVLADPNELALAMSLAVPFAFAIFEIRRSLPRFLLLVASVVLIGIALVLTRSRGGQLAFAAVLGAYFVRRLGGLQGLVAAAVLAAPLVVLGGRSSDSASQSSMERLTTAGAGIKMLLAYPIRGVGYLMYGEHHPLTAHNAYILAAGELGLLGLVLFAVLLLLSFKITLAVLGHPFAPRDRDAPVLRALAMAELAALAGLLIGIFFLSWTYHFVLWIHFGIAGAFFAVMQRKDARFTVRASTGELMMVTILPPVALGIYAVQIMRMGCW